LNKVEVSASQLLTFDLRAADFFKPQTQNAKAFLTRIKMKTTCPHCNAALNIPEGYSATQAQCPQCKRAFEISESDEEYAEAGTSPVFIVLSAVAVFAAFLLGNVSGYYIAQPKRNAAQREAGAAKAEILRLSKALTEQERTHNSEANKFQVAAKQQKAEENLPAYRIVKQEDVSFATTVRLCFRIQVDGPLSEYDLQRICEKIIAREKTQHPHNAISFMFYLPGTDTNSAYSGGTADWAPYGDWNKADTVSTGDYSKHKLAVKTGNALIPDRWASEVKRTEGEIQSTGLPLATQKRIFYDLVAAQDAGIVDADEAYDVIAKRHKVDVATVRKIGVVGALNSWPMPPAR